MFDRVLSIPFDEFEKLTERFKWRFYEVINDEQIRVEVPKSDNEILVIYLPVTDENVRMLEHEGFIKQMVKGWREW